MTPRRNVCALIVRTTFVFAILAIANIAAFGQLVNDASLRLWLKADTLSGATVPTWNDSSSYGTVLQTPPLPPGDTSNDASNHTPQLVTVTNNGVVFKAVQFRQAFDPITADPTYGHLSDRLWQTSNLDANDPTLIDPSSDITMIAVFRNEIISAGVGPAQTMFAKRTATACPLEMGFYWGGLGISTLLTPPDYFFYSRAGAYSPQAPVPAQPEWTILEINVTADGTMTMRDFYKSLGGWRTSSMTGVGRAGGQQGDPFCIGFHMEGQGGSTGNPWGNGAYERFGGEICEFALYAKSLSSNELANAENYLLAKYFIQPGPPIITVQPKSQTISDFEPVTFSVLADGTLPFTYQWLKDGTPISGAVGSSYTISSVMTSNAGVYSVIVSNSISYTTSQPATLSVIGAPTINSALLDYADHTKVTVTYSVLVDPATATNKANYSISNSVNILSVEAIPQTNSPAWTNYIYSVVLTTSPISAKTTLTVNGVTDRGGIAATNAQAVILSPATVAAPPAENRLLWLAADTGVLADDLGVFEWDDQSGAANDHDALYEFGNPKPGKVAFANAIHPVVSFDGTAGLVCNNSADFNVQNLTVYVVGDVDNTAVSRCFLCNWPGWAMGISDGQPGVIKWVSHTTGGDFSMEPGAGHLGNRVPTLISGTFASPGDKNLIVNGSLIGVQSNTPPIDYSPLGVMVGAAFTFGGQNLIGDIAEILVYTNVSSSQDAAIRSYLAGKYFSPSATVPQLLSASRNGTTNVTVSFSMPLGALTATNVANYAIDQGVTVSAVTLVDQTSVMLTTSPLNGSSAYTLTVNNVSDWAGNAVAQNSQALIAATSNPLLNIGLQGNSVSITWSALAPYKLQSAGSMLGPWSTVPSATSPYLIAPTQTNQFYRLSQ